MKLLNYRSNKMRSKAHGVYYEYELSLLKLRYEITKMRYEVLKWKREYHKAPKNHSQQDSKK